jgi:hypothetical protein
MRMKAVVDGMFSSDDGEGEDAGDVVDGVGDVPSGDVEAPGQFRGRCI